MNYMVVVPGNSAPRLLDGKTPCKDPLGILCYLEGVAYYRAEDSDTFDVYVDGQWKKNAFFAMSTPSPDTTYTFEVQVTLTDPLVKQSPDDEQWVANGVKSKLLKGSSFEVDFSKVEVNLKG